MAKIDLEAYSAAQSKRIRDGYGKKIPESQFNVYTVDEIERQPDGPFSFAWCFSWNKDIDQKAWQGFIHNFALSFNHIYPGHHLSCGQFEASNKRQCPIIQAMYYSKTRRCVRGNIAFVEVDVIANRQCDPFNQDFDIGLTDSSAEWPMMPFNAGVMFAKDTPGAQKFLDTAMEFAHAFPANTDPWYLYQLSLSHAYWALKDEVNIKIFPHRYYNYVPERFEQTDAYFIHLKGQRKKFQEQFIDEVLSRRGDL